MEVKEGVEVKKSVEVRLRETDLKKHGRTRCDLCVGVKGSVEVKECVEVKESIDKSKVQVKS